MTERDPLGGSPIGQHNHPDARARPHRDELPVLSDDVRVHGLQLDVERLAELVAPAYPVEHGPRPKISSAGRVGRLDRDPRRGRPPDLSPRIDTASGHAPIELTHHPGDDADVTLSSSRRLWPGGFVAPTVTPRQPCRAGPRSRPSGRPPSPTAGGPRRRCPGLPFGAGQVAVVVTTRSHSRSSTRALAAAAPT